MARRRRLSPSDAELFEIDAPKVDVPPPAPKPPPYPKGESAAQLAARGVMRKAVEARGSLEKFFGFVMRHELTGKLLTPTPHQRVMFSFIDAHPYCVLRLPVGTSKTYTTAAWALRKLGSDPTQRGAFISGSAWQAQKPLAMAKDYITAPNLAARTSLVYPQLRPSDRPDDPWTQTEATIERPRGIRDPSMVARGYEGKVAGARLGWEAIDDIVDDENSASSESCAKTNARLHGRFLSRLDPDGGEVLVCNTPWNRKDATYHLELEAGWPTLSMSIEGDVWCANADAAWAAMAEAELLRPALKPERWRLRAHDPDPNDAEPLWPERYSRDKIAELRRKTLPYEYARLYLCEPFDENAARCQREWIEKCKKNGLGMTLVSSYSGPNPTFTGLDLGIGDGRQHGKTVFTTFELRDDGSRRLLDVEGGRYTGKQIVTKLIDKHDAYGSSVSVESVSAQDFIRQWALDVRVDLNIKPYTTNRANKRSLDFGVESIFTEFQNGAWAIPCDRSGRCHPEVQALIDDMLYYQPPPAHTGDYLMSLFFARERARKASRGNPSFTPGSRANTQEQSLSGF